jgi:hypothetical protein
MVEIPAHPQAGLAQIDKGGRITTRLQLQPAPGQQQNGHPDLVVQRRDFGRLQLAVVQTARIDHDSRGQIGRLEDLHTALHNVGQNGWSGKEAEKGRKLDDIFADPWA